MATKSHKNPVAYEALKAAIILRQGFSRRSLSYGRQDGRQVAAVASKVSFFVRFCASLSPKLLLPRSAVS
jgi:hypothetical protein